jgi:molybdopterin converting factor small subunit
MSYLRGPLTREHIKKLMAGRKPDAPAGPAPAVSSAAASEKLVLGRATVRYSDSKNKIDHDVEVALLAPVSGRTNAPDWNESSDASDRSIDGTPVPPNMAKAWEREFASWLADNRSLEIFRAPGLKLSSQPGESERDFRAHVDQTLREERDREVAALRQKYASKFATIEDRIRRAEAAVQKQSEQASQAKLSTALSIGAGLLGALLGGGRRGSIGKISTGARSAGRAYSESQDVSRAEENVEALQQQLAGLQAEVEAKVQELQVEYDPAREKIETVTIRPKKTGIVVRSLLQLDQS